VKEEPCPKEMASKTMQSKEIQIEQHDAPCEMAKGQSEQRAQQLVAEFALEDVTEKRVLDFLRRMLEFCDFHRHLRVLGRLAASHLVLGAKSLNNKALHFMLHHALWVEQEMRGSEDLKEIFAAGSTLEQVCSFCNKLDQIVRASFSRSGMIRFLRHDDGLYTDTEEGEKLYNSPLLLEKEEEMLGQDDMLFHSLPGAKTHLCSVVLTDKRTKI